MDSSWAARTPNRERGTLSRITFFAIEEEEAMAEEVEEEDGVNYEMYVPLEYGGTNENRSKQDYKRLFFLSWRFFIWTKIRLLRAGKMLKM